MRVLVIVAVVIVTVAHGRSFPSKPKIQIFEIHQNPTWKDSQQYRRPKTLPSTLIPGMDLDNIDRPKILVYEILKNKNEILLKELGNMITDENEESDINSHEVRKMTANRNEDASDRDEVETRSTKRQENSKFEGDTDPDYSDDTDIGFVDETRLRQKLEKIKKQGLRSAQTNIEVVLAV